MIQVPEDGAGWSEDPQVYWAQLLAALRESEPAGCPCVADGEECQP